MPEISLDDFKRVELRVAKVLDASEIAGADRIWRLLIDVGTEKKEIVAGIKKFYSREQLLNKSIVVVNNLAPSTIRGVESRGMLLAAKSDAHLTVLTLDHDVPAGSLIG